MFILYMQNEKKGLIELVSPTAQAGSRRSLWEERAQFIAEGAGVGYWDWELKPDRVEWTALCKRLFGIPLEEPTSYARFLAAVHPDDRIRTDLAVRACLESQGERSYDIEYRVLWPDGTVHWIHAKGSATFDKTRPVRMAGIALDITERKQAEEAASHLAAIVGSSSDAILSKDLDGIITSWNRGAVALFGYTPAEIIGQPVQRLIPPERFAEEKVILARIAAGEDIEQYETVRLHKDGKPIYVSVTISPIRDKAGKVTGASKVLRDITARKRAEEALRESEERFRALTSASSEVLYQMNADWTEMVRLSGGGFLADTESPDRNWLDRYIHPDDQPHVTAAVQKAIRTKSIFELEHRVRVAGGAIGWTASRAVPILDGQGEITSWFGVASNITARKRAEQQVQTLMRELNHRSKNTLALVQAIARQTIVSNPEDFAARFAERIQALAAAQDLLVKNEWKGVDLGELVRSQLAHFSGLIGTRIELNGPPLFISASAAQTIGMALYELATNAGKYGALSNSTGRIAVDWSLDRAETGAETFAIAWRESGGPAVTAPKRRGFGSAVIGELAEMSLGAKPDLSFASAGLSWRLECAAGEILDRSTKHANPAPGSRQPGTQ